MSCFDPPKRPICQESIEGSVAEDLDGESQEIDGLWGDFPNCAIVNGIDYPEQRTTKALKKIWANVADKG